jgi:hypothetical protein
MEITLYDKGGSLVKLYLKCWKTLSIYLKYFYDFIFWYLLPLTQKTVYVCIVCYNSSDDYTCSNCDLSLAELQNGCTLCI